MRVLSRAYVLTSIALLFPSISLAHLSSRRSLNFRADPKVDFSTNSLTVLDSDDPHKVAHAFLSRLPYPAGSYFIRKDSYTDANTGVSHIYVRQVVNGLEVVDGNINLNIRDGQVLSQGNSFFKGSAESSLLSVPNWHQSVYCNELPSYHFDPACGSTLDHLQKVASLNGPDPSTFLHDPRAAAFFFMQIAHPDPASSAFTFASLEAKPHGCTDPLEEDTSCSGWLVSGHLNDQEPIRARQVYLQTPGTHGSTHLNLAWRLEVPMPDNYYEAYVSVNDPTKIISVSDWIVDAPAPDNHGSRNILKPDVRVLPQEALASADQITFGINPADISGRTGRYRVWLWGVNDPGSGESRVVLETPRDRTRSPLGWHATNADNDPLRTSPTLDPGRLVHYNTTIGNNVLVQGDWAVSDDRAVIYRPSGGPHLNFDFPYNAKVEPRQNINSSITQIFFIANVYHDMLHQYGFDEDSGNFQQFNFGKGGAQRDAIRIYAQDGKGFNNANFLTRPDGEAGVCRMRLWDKSKPMRDSGFDAGVLVHELTHGLSTRLTGGPRNNGCLTHREARGLGEGWSDFIATLVRSKHRYKDYPIAAWLENNINGAREYIYSTSMKTNPLLYDYLRLPKYREEHYAGEIWAEILYVVLYKLIDKHGFVHSLSESSHQNFYRYITRKNGRQSKFPRYGNSLMLQLVVNGMKTQGCDPTFLRARDAIISADEALTDGENKCALWRGFAERGLGVNAQAGDWRGPVNGFDVLSECK